MAINVKLPEALVETAKRYGNIEHRSVLHQNTSRCHFRQHKYKKEPHRFIHSKTIGI